MVVVKNPALKGYAVEAPAKARAKSKVSIKSRVVILAGIAALVLLIFLIQTTQIYLTKNHIFQLERQLNTVQESYNSINLEVSQLKRPDRIIPIAKQKCGLIVPEEDQFVAVYYN